MKGMVMSDFHVSLDSSQLDATERKLQDPLEEQLSSALEAAASRVNEEYDGESVEEVQTKLVEETCVGLHPDIAERFPLSEEEVRPIAEAITRDEAGA